MIIIEDPMKFGKEKRQENKAFLLELYMSSLICSSEKFLCFVRKFVKEKKSHFHLEDLNLVFQKRDFLY